jgi:hypothetical protein
MNRGSDISCKSLYTCITVTQSNHYIRETILNTFNAVTQWTRILYTFWKSRIRLLAQRSASPIFHGCSHILLTNSSEYFQINLLTVLRYLIWGCGSPVLNLPCPVSDGFQHCDFDTQIHGLATLLFMFSVISSTTLHTGRHRAGVLYLLPLHFNHCEYWFVAGMYEAGWQINWNGFGRKLPWPNQVLSRHLPGRTG